MVALSDGRALSKWRCSGRPAVRMTFSKDRRAKLHSKNPTERLNGEIKPSSEVVGTFQNEAAITRRIGAILMEQSDEWAVQRARYMTLETMAP